MRTSLLLPMLLSAACFAEDKTIIVQSHAVTVVYDDTIARHYPNARLIALRDFSSDVHDNIADTFAIVARKAKDYDNLVVLGYDGSYDHSNVKVFPLFTSLDYVEPVINAFSSAPIHTVCNKICPSLGTIHRVSTLAQLRKTLFTLASKKDIVVVNSVLQVFDEDTQVTLYGSDVSKVFKINKTNLDVSVLYNDLSTAVSISYSAESIARGAPELRITVNLARINNLGFGRQLLNAAKLYDIGAKP